MIDLTYDSLTYAKCRKNGSRDSPHGDKFIPEILNFVIFGVLISHFIPITVKFGMTKWTQDSFCAKFRKNRSRYSPVMQYGIAVEVMHFDF